MLFRSIRAHHASFYDFLKRRTTNEWAEHRPEIIHSLILRNCMVVLNSQLQFNICNIDVPVLNKDIPDLAERTGRNISEELQYSTQFWFTHLASSTMSVFDAADDVRELICTRKLLFWLEALSLQGVLTRSDLAFVECVSYFQVRGEFVAIVEANLTARSGSERSNCGSCQRRPQICGSVL